MCNEVLGRLGGRFEALYSGMGRPSIPREMLLRAKLLQAVYLQLDHTVSGGFLLRRRLAAGSGLGAAITAGTNTIPVPALPPTADERPDPRRTAAAGTKRIAAPPR
ncbi:hypothetical protein X749_30650 [Mesorhizobium sp. LNJC391B00]|nr:hypothetical protein X749_30650 [Mesorhizobium sp. LNJC391B00]